MLAHVKDGTIVRISTDQEPEEGDQLQLRACLRGRAYRNRLYHPDRLKYPMKRVGKRGEGKFERITWDEATDTIAAEIKRIKNEYGPEGIYVQYASGIPGLAAEKQPGCGVCWAYTAATWITTAPTAPPAPEAATPYTYGTTNTGSSRDTLVDAKLIILWGFNPAETVHGTNTTYYLRRAKEAGAKIIVVDPRYSDTAVALADEWIPLLPTTDNALMDAMTYVMIEESLYDGDFVSKYCIGFDEDQMPEGSPPNNSLKSYITGEGRRGGQDAGMGGSHYQGAGGDDPQIGSGICHA
ncbi:MAG: molybdopterin-dependent oxidoreductase [Bacillota bacterium]